MNNSRAPYPPSLVALYQIICPFIRFVSSFVQHTFGRLDVMAAPTGWWWQFDYFLYAALNEPFVVVPFLYTLLRWPWDWPIVTPFRYFRSGNSITTVAVFHYSVNHGGKLEEFSAKSSSRKWRFRSLSLTSSCRFRQKANWKSPTNYFPSLGIVGWLTSPLLLPDLRPMFF